MLAGVPVEEWGKGAMKSIDHFLEEIVQGESTLEISALRRVRVAAVEVCYDTRILREEKQVFADGRTRTRDLESSLGEKLKPGEEPEDAAKRALREELEFSGDLEVTPLRTITKGPEASKSYPGLQTEYVMHWFIFYVPARLFRPEGYVVTEADGKTTHYVWKED